MLQLKKLSQSAVTNLRKRWLTQLDAIIQSTGATYLASDFERIFDWCEKHCDEQNGGCVYILETASGDQRAVAEITDASKSKDPSFKFLNVYLEPDLNTDWREKLDSALMAEIASILGTVIIRAVELASKKGTNKLKIYGRTDEMNGIFDAILSHAGEHPTEGLKLYKQSKWLVIEMETAL